jgi:Ca2+-transporting ATPase
MVLTVFIPLAWICPNIFSPIHIIFLELIMGPTCSIIYENEPTEKHTMLQKPRLLMTNFFNWRELTTRIIQGLMITSGTLLKQGFEEAQTQSMVFTCLIAANILLTLVNRSIFNSLFTTIKYKNNLFIFIMAITLLLTGLLLYIKPATFFGFEPLNGLQLLISAGAGFVSVLWYEIVKLYKRRQQPEGA